MSSALSRAARVRGVRLTALLGLLHAVPPACSGGATEAGLWPLPARSASGATSILVAPSLSVVLDGMRDAISDFAQRRLVDAIAWRAAPGAGRDPFLAPTRAHLSRRAGAEDVPCSIDAIRVVVSETVAYPFVGTDESYTITVPSCDEWSETLDQSRGQIEHAGCREIEVRAQTSVGAARAAETLLQLVRRLDAADGEAGRLVIFDAPWHIVDAPRFLHRGLLVDSSRNFLPVQALLKTIEAMAMSKMNVLHWHIVDAPSFPLRLASVPSLARGAYSPAHTYSPEDIRKIVEFAAERGVRVLPEIDMPGHAFAWSASHPHLVTCAAAQPWEQFCAEPPCGQLDPTLSETYELIAKVLGEVARLFPDPVVHLGADEINFECWLHSAALRERLARDGAAAAAAAASPESLRALWQEFENKVLQTAAYLGKRVLLWQDALDEGLALPANVTIQVWKGSEDVERVVSAGHEVVVSSAEVWYLDCGRGSWVDGGRSWCDPFKSWEVMWGFDPTESVQAGSEHLVLGGETCMWTEQVDDANLHAVVWPRAAAVAERLWSDKSNTDVGAAKIRLAEHRERLVSSGVSASPLHPYYCTVVAGACDSHASGQAELSSRGVVEFPAAASASVL